MSCNTQLYFGLFMIILFFITIIISIIILKKENKDIERTEKLYKLIQENPNIELDELIKKSDLPVNRVLKIIKDLLFFRDIGIIIYPLYEGDD